MSTSGAQVGFDHAGDASEPRRHGGIVRDVGRGGRRCEWGRLRRCHHRGPWGGEPTIVGSAYVYLGSPGGLSAPPTAFALPNGAFGYFGGAVAFAPEMKDTRLAGVRVGVPGRARPAFGASLLLGGDVGILRSETVGARSSAAEVMRRASSPRTPRTHLIRLGAGRIHEG